MRLRNLVLAACAAFGLAMPAQAQLTFEWHLVSLTPANNNASTLATARTNAAISQNFFTGAGALNPGQTIMLQLMIRDNNASGMTFPWAFGDGIQSPPNSNINGVGILAWGAVPTTGNAAVFRPTGDNPTPTQVFNNRGTPPIDSELAGTAVPLPATGYPAPPGDYSGAVPAFTPYNVAFSNFTANSIKADALANVTQVGNPWENGDFPRDRGGPGGFLMPLFNMRFTAVSAGNTVLQLVDPGTAADILVTGANGAVLPGGDMLDAGMFSSYVPLNIEVVPEPTSMALVGMALAGLGYRKLRRNKKTTEVAA